MVDISWDAVFQTSFSIALVLVPVFVAYLLNEWAKRRGFEREKKYDRKREAYEKALAALRRIWDATLMLKIIRPAVSDQESRIQQPLLANVDPEKRKEFLEAIDDVSKLIGGSLAISRFTDDELPPELDEAGGLDEAHFKDVLQRLTGRASNILLRVLNRADDELVAALSTLTLAGAPTPVLSELKRLRHPDDLKKESGDSPTEWIEEQLTKLETSMKGDLQATIGKSWRLRPWKRSSP